MVNPFAAIETSLAAVTTSALANATATLPDGSAVGGVFDANYADPLGIAASTPRFTAPTAELSALEPGDEIALGAGAYWTVRAIQPDGAGMTRLILESA